MAHVQQIAHGFGNRCTVAKPHASAALGRRETAAVHPWQTALRELGDEFRPLADAGERHGVNPARHEVADLRQLLRGVVVADGQKHMSPRHHHALLKRLQAARKDGVVDGGQHHAHRAAAAQAHGARSGVRHIGQPRNGRQDFVAQNTAHGLWLVDGARHRGGRHTGGQSHVGKRWGMGPLAHVCAELQSPAIACKDTAAAPAR